MTYSVEEVRKQANYEGRASGEPRTEQMLTAYADLLEQIERAKAGIPKWEDERERIDPTHMFAQYKFVEDELNAYRAVSHLLPRGELVKFPRGAELAIRALLGDMKARLISATSRKSIEHIVAMLDAPTADPVAQIDTCTELNCPRCHTHPDHRGDMEHAGIGSRPTADPVTQGEGDFISNDDAEALATWLDKKYKRHGEIEDQQAANLLRLLAAQPRVPDELGTDEFAQLKEFYGVQTLKELVFAQLRHIERMQSKLPALQDSNPRTPREG